MIFCISLLSVMISPFSFLIVLTWFFSLFPWWVWLMICLKVGSKNQLLVLLIVAIVSFASFSFISALIFMILLLLLLLLFFKFLLLTLWCFFSSLSYFRCKVRFFVFFLIFLEVGLNCYESPSQHCFYWIPQDLGCHVFIFICFYAYFDFLFYFFHDLLVIEKCAV